MSGVIRLLGLIVGKDENLVLLSSYGGDRYNDSPRVLFEAMRKDPRFERFHYTWAFSDPDKYAVEGAQIVKIDSLKYFIEALRAKIWITNVNIERGLHFKQKRQIYVNTWHGTGPKKSGNAVKGRKDYDFSKVDILCVDSVLMHDIFMKYYNAREDSLIWCGRPREDELVSYSAKDRVELRKKYGIDDTIKVVLYMPTWREYETKELNYKLWKETLGDNYRVFIRNHHFSKLKNLPDDRYFKDVTDIENVNELYCVADVLVSDYSSAFWDYALLNKPMFSYAFDYDQFEDSLLLNVKEEFKGWFFEEEEDLLKGILKSDEIKSREMVGEFVKKYISRKGNATTICLNRIDDFLGKRNLRNA